MDKGRYFETIIQDRLTQGLASLYIMQKVFRGELQPSQDELPLGSEDPKRYAKEYVGNILWHDMDRHLYFLRAAVKMFYLRSSDMRLALFGGRTRLSKLPYDQVVAAVGRARVFDPNSSPEDVWRWAYERVNDPEQDYGWAQAPLREWGYVMWDRARLDKVEVFRRPYFEAVEQGILSRWMARQAVSDETLWQRLREIHTEFANSGRLDSLPNV